MSFIEELTRLKNPVFTMGDIRKIAGLSDPYLKVCLNRLVKSVEFNRVVDDIRFLTKAPASIKEAIKRNLKEFLGENILNPFLSH